MTKSKDTNNNCVAFSSWLLLVSFWIPIVIERGEKCTSLFLRIMAKSIISNSNCVVFRKESALLFLVIANSPIVFHSDWKKGPENEVFLMKAKCTRGRAAKSGILNNDCVDLSRKARLSTFERDIEMKTPLLYFDALKKTRFRVETFLARLSWKMPKVERRTCGGLNLGKFLRTNEGL